MSGGICINLVWKHRSGQWHAVNYAIQISMLVILVRDTHPLFVSAFHTFPFVTNAHSVFSMQCQIALNINWHYLAMAIFTSNFCYLSARFIPSFSAFYELFTHIFAFVVDVQRFDFISSELLARRTVMAFMHEGVPTFVARKSTLLCEDCPDVVAVNCAHSSMSGLWLHNEFHVFFCHPSQKDILCADWTQKLFDTLHSWHC